MTQFHAFLSLKSQLILSQRTIALIGGDLEWLIHRAQYSNNLLSNDQNQKQSMKKRFIVTRKNGNFCFLPRQWQIKMSLNLKSIANIFHRPREIYQTATRIANYAKKTRLVCWLLCLKCYARSLIRFALSESIRKGEHVCVISYMHSCKRELDAYHKDLNYL